MQRQWQVQRTVQEYEDGQKRWNRAYLLVLEITRSIEESQEKPIVEVNHASSNLCPGIDPTPSISPND